MIKQRKSAGTFWNKKRKATQEKMSIKLEETNQKVVAKDGRLKRYRDEVKQHRQNRTFQNNERKFYQQIGGDGTKTYQQPDTKGTKQFWIKIGQPRERNKKTEWISNMAKELEELKGPKAKIHIDSFRTTLKISNWKTPDHDGIHGFWFKKFVFIHDRLALEMNRRLQEADIPE